MTEKFKCTYPNCNKEGLYEQSFELINEENANVELLFCKYHHLIVMGGHFKAKINKVEYEDSSDHSFELIGPFKEIELIQQVIGAREMIAKLKTKK